MLRTAVQAFYIFVKILAVYFAVISVFAFARTRRLPEPKKRLRFAVLVPARNEERCVAGIVESIKNQRYSGPPADIYVIPNNCSDCTEEAARRAGAQILRVSENVRSKGAALHEAMALLADDSRFDAFCVFDADNEADEGFLEAMNRTLCAGANVAKSRILSKNRRQSWVCACYDIYFCIANQFLNRARGNLGMSARLIGTGFAVNREFLRSIGGWNTETITEDAEFYAQCAIRGEKIAYCEGAVTYDEEPLDFATSLVQRKRWMSGVMQVAQQKAPQLARGLKRTRSFLTCFDASVQFAFLYIQAFLPFLLLVSLALDPASVLRSLPLSLALGYGGGLLNAVLALALERRLSKDMLPGILMYPLFLASFILLQTVSLFLRTERWRETLHTGVRLRVGERARIAVP